MLASRVFNMIMSEIANDDGIENTRLVKLLAEYFAAGRTRQEIDDLSLGKRKYKKFVEEVLPVSKFLAHQRMNGRVRFPLDSKIPDAWYMPGDGSKTGIEVTLALGKARNAVAKQLVEKGESGGLLGLLQNTDSKETYMEVRDADREGFSTEFWSNAAHRGIMERIEDKSRKRAYDNMYLLIPIDAPTFTDEYWQPVIEDLRSMASDTSFLGVYVVETVEKKVYCLKDARRDLQ